MLKSQLAQQEISLQDAICERDKFKFILEQNNLELETYTETLSIIKVHETNAALFEVLQSTMQTDHDQSITRLERELALLKHQILSLQTECIELKMRL